MDNLDLEGRRVGAQMGVGDDSNNGTALGGGSIVIHSGNANAAGVSAESVPQATAALTNFLYLPVVNR